MQHTSLFKDVQFRDDKPAVQLLLDTEFTKEIRIAFRADQLMKEHQTPFPIVVEVVSGSIRFGVNGQHYDLAAGALLSLAGGVPHDLLAKEESIVRLTLSKGDQAKRVAAVAEQ